jgi:hypothetical protein
MAAIDLYPLSQGLNAGVDGFMRGRRLAREEEEWERQKLREDAASARQRAIDDRAFEQYEYAKSQRPTQERSAALDIQSREADIEQKRLEHKKLLSQFNADGMVMAMKLLQANRPQEAAQVINTSQPQQTRGFRPHPEKKGVWIGVDEQGQSTEFDPKSVIDVFSSQDWQLGKQGMWNRNTGEYRAPGEIKGFVGEAPDKDIMKEREVEAMVARNYPRKLAEGIVYGSIKQIQSPNGLETTFVDLRPDGRSQVVGALDVNGAWKLDPGFFDDGGGDELNRLMSAAKSDPRAYAEVLRRTTDASEEEIARRVANKFQRQPPPPVPLPPGYGQR